MEDREAARLRDSTPRDELDILIREATTSVEADLALEDSGWVNLSSATGDVVTDAERVTNMKLSRVYATKDPLGKQSIRLWTDYTFGSGMYWDSEEDKTTKVLESFWESPANNKVLSARGQRLSSDKLLIDGEIFFALFLGSGGQATIRRIDPLEITEIITDPDDKENIKFYRRQWYDALGTVHDGIYRDVTNIKGESVPNVHGAVTSQTEEALIYYLNYNTISQRGNPLLLPALDWIKYYRKFLSSRIAIMLALAKFAWRTKVTGGQAAVDSIKAKTNDQEITAGSHLLENLGSDTTPIKTETGAQGAYSDGRQIKLQVAAAVGIPEQYFGDISIGNLATAKTVELPMMKMFQSYQKVWLDTYQDIDNVVLAHNKVAPDKWYVDRQFPPIAPEDVLAAATAITTILAVIPDLAYSDDVKQMALTTMGINDPAEVLDALNKEAKSNPEVALTRALKQFRESIKQRN